MSRTYELSARTWSGSASRHHRFNTAPTWTPHAYHPAAEDPGDRLTELDLSITVGWSSPVALVMFELTCHIRDRRREGRPGVRRRGGGRCGSEQPRRLTVAAGLDGVFGVAELDRLRAELVPRAWVMARVESWLDTGDTPVILVTGPPGTGKTSFATQLVFLNETGDGSWPNLSAADLVLAHFCDASNERTLDALDFVRALSQGLAARIPGFADALASSAADASAVVSINASQSIGTVAAGASVANVQISLPRDVPTRQAFARLVRRPLEAVLTDGWERRLLVVVDDVSSGFHYDSADNIAGLIGAVAENPAELPPPLRFVVTSRPDPWVLRALPASAVDLRDDRPPGTDEIQRYAYRRLSTIPKPRRRAWVERLGDVADGNFLYARHMIDHLLAHDDMLKRGPAGADLPSGLTDLYRRWFTTSIGRSRDTWWDYHQPVLSALTVAQGAGLTLDQLAGIAALPRSRVRRTVEECAQFLLGSPRSGPVRIYHNSFRDYLAAEEVSTDEAHRAVTDYFLRRHGDRWFDADQYARDHLVTHAAASATSLRW